MEDSQDTSVLEVQDAAGVQEASAASTPIQIEENDLLRYRLAGSEHRYSQLTVDLCTRELQHAQIDLSVKIQEVRKLVAVLEAKYKFNLNTHSITEDGYLVPRQLQR